MINKELFLDTINLNEDKTKEIFASEDCQKLLAMWEDYYPTIGFNFPWVGYYIKHKNKIVGCCAFTGKPINNTVEISYWTFKENEGQGIAKWACKELISIAKKTEPQLTVMAKTAPENNASTHILKQNGFVYEGVTDDHEIGEAWKWVLP